MRTRTIYWTTTAVITFVILFSLYKMFTPAYDRLGFPRYFRIELLVAKLLGLAALLVPRVPLRIKDAAYVGFAILLVSASMAHLGSGDPLLNVIEPYGFLAVLITSNVYLHKLHRADGRAIRLRSPSASS